MNGFFALSTSLTYNIVVDNRGREIDFSSKECNSFGLSSESLWAIQFFVRINQDC